MQLQQLDPLRPQPAQALLDLIPQDVRPPVEPPSPVAADRATPTLVVMTSSSG
ncbi:hypothetical protein PV721_25305 [Streptomyces sp. MB09-01]|nr:hypothetical protein [Streptomyces sp. MB09-01]MDX3537627.1 hypothetical protein [Streptomyces sp. MB09-01]